LTRLLFTTQVAKQLLADFPELERVAAWSEGDVNLPEQVSSWAREVSSWARGRVAASSEGDVNLPEQVSSWAREYVFT